MRISQLIVYMGYTGVSVKNDKEYTQGMDISNVEITVEGGNPPTQAEMDASYDAAVAYYDNLATKFARISELKSTLPDIYFAICAVFWQVDLMRNALQLQNNSLYLTMLDEMNAITNTAELEDLRQYE